MVNAKDIVAGKKDKSELGVKAGMRTHSVIELETAVPYFVMMINTQQVKPVHKATVEKYGDQWDKTRQSVGNGAFAVDNGC